MDDRQLRRPRTGNVLAGVCAGLAEYIGMDVVAVRVIYLLLTIFTAFSGVLIYIILALVIPQKEY